MIILYIFLALFALAFLIRAIKWFMMFIYDIAPHVILLLGIAAGYWYLSKVNDGRNTQTIEDKSGCSWDGTDWFCGEISLKTTTGRKIK